MNLKQKNYNADFHNEVAKILKEISLSKKYEKSYAVYTDSVNYMSLSFTNLKEAKKWFNIFMADIKAEKEESRLFLSLLLINKEDENDVFEIILKNKNFKKQRRIL